MIHRPFRLTEIMIKMSHYKIEPKRLQFIHPIYRQRTGIGTDRRREGRQIQSYCRTADHYIRREQIGKELTNG